MRKSNRKIPASIARQVIVRRLPHTHVLVADAGTARILHEVDGALKEIASLENAAAHLPGRALVTDRAGRVFDSGSRTGRGAKTQSRHGAQSDYDPHAIEVDRFARKVAKLLDAESRHGDLEQVVIIAAPKFLGVLRPLLSARVQKQVKRQLARDLVRSSEAAIYKAAFPRRRK